MPYKVSTPVFEGPFDLLLHLIIREQVDIWEVSIARIVDGYVANLEQMRAGLDLEVATEFLLTAAVLLELKARRLLPGKQDAEPEEELALWEERDLLVARLLECKTFKDAAKELERVMDQASRSWPRTAGPEERFEGVVPDLLAGVSPRRLGEVLAALLLPRPAPKVLLDHVAPVRASVGEALARLSGELAALGRATFASLTAGLTERMEVVVSFLALLEMYKQGLVDLEQPTTFGELTVLWLGPPDSERLDSTAVEEYQG